MSSGGTEQAMAVDPAELQEYEQLTALGLDARVVAKLQQIFRTGKLVHGELDERALDALRGLSPDGALAVLDQFVESSLQYVSNKSAFVCGIMKSYRHKVRALGLGSVAPGRDGAFDLKPVGKGPDPTRLEAILHRSGYPLDVTTGQRRYGPPTDWTGDAPGAGCEVFCGRIPRSVYEDELIPLFEQCGTVWDLRLMMDPLTGLNRGYAFVTFTTAEAAREAVRQVNGADVRGRQLTVNVSAPNRRLFVGNIPKCKSKEEIDDEVSKVTDGLLEVIVYSSPDEGRKNRGFCFLEFESHKSASVAKRRLTNSRGQVFGCDIIVDWADPLDEPPEEVMSTVKVLYVRNLTQHVTEQRLKEAFEAHGPVHRVKKIKDYAFVHFEERRHALDALRALDGQVLHGVDAVQVSLAKPPSDPRRKEEMLKARERRLIQQRNPMQRCDGLLPLPTPPAEEAIAPSPDHGPGDCDVVGPEPCVEAYYNNFYPSYAYFYNYQPAASVDHLVQQFDRCWTAVAPNAAPQGQEAEALAGGSSGQRPATRRGRHPPAGSGGFRTERPRRGRSRNQLRS